METMTLAVIALLILGIAVVSVLFVRKNAELSELREKFSPIHSVSKEIEALEQRRSRLDEEMDEEKKRRESKVSAEIAQLEQQRSKLRAEIAEKRKGWETDM